MVYEVLLHKFKFGLRLAAEEDTDRQDNAGMGKGIKMADNEALWMATADREQVFSKMLTLSVLGPTDVERHL